MKIVYFGASEASSTSKHRAEALRRMGCKVTIFDPWDIFNIYSKNKYVKKFHYNTGYNFIQNKVFCWVEKMLSTTKAIDLIWVDSGELFGPKVLQMLKSNNNKVVLYNHDDPTGMRDGRRFLSLKKAIPYYDICAVVRNENIHEFNQLGATQVVKLWRSYDEIEHAPFTDIHEIQDKYLSDVVFIGTWMRHEGRDKFLLRLIEAGLNVRIWGQRWEKSPYWPQLKENVAGRALSGRDYVAAIQGAKVCLGLLSKGNRDLHTTRSMEIPYAGGVLCAQRTTEHLELYLENVEAVFWDNVEECILQCKKLLKNDELRENIRRAGMQRVREMKLGHEDQCKNIIDAMNSTQNDLFP